MRRTTSTLVLLFLLAGCGSGDDGDDDNGDGGGDGGGGSTAAEGCPQLAERWCELACNCTAGAECTMNRGIVTETHDSEAKCTTFYSALGCDTAPEDPSWVAACDQALSSAQCDGTEGLLYPEACHY